MDLNAARQAAKKAVRRQEDAGSSQQAPKRVRVTGPSRPDRRSAAGGEQAEPVRAPEVQEGRPRAPAADQDPPARSGAGAAAGVTTDPGPTQARSQKKGKAPMTSGTAAELGSAGLERAEGGSGPRMVQVQGDTPDEVRLTLTVRKGDTAFGDASVARELLRFIMLPDDVEAKRNQPVAEMIDDIYPSLTEVCMLGAEYISLF